MPVFIDAPIDGVIVRPLQKHHDHRGWLVELFRQDELDPPLWPVMAYVSETLAGVARGPHEHLRQTDFFAFLGPSTFRVYLWDNRPTAGPRPHRMVMELGESSPAMLIVPPGVAHAYRNVGDRPGWVFNCPNALYRGPGKTREVDEIRHEGSPDCPFVME